MEIKFIGAAREVTGSKHLITTRHGKKILLDCGMFQGQNKETMLNVDDFTFAPNSLIYSRRLVIPFKSPIPSPFESLKLLGYI